jgi:hypothetical protein
MRSTGRSVAGPSPRIRNREDPTTRDRGGGEGAPDRRHPDGRRTRQPDTRQHGEPQASAADHAGASAAAAVAEHRPAPAAGFFRVTAPTSSGIDMTKVWTAQHAGSTARTARWVCCVGGPPAWRSARRRTRMPTPLTVASVESRRRRSAWLRKLGECVDHEPPAHTGPMALTALLAKHSLGVVRASGGADGAPQC